MKLRVPARPQDLVGDERPGALDETLHGGLEVGRRLGRDREDNAAERVRQLSEPGLEVHEAALDLRLASAGRGRR